MTEESAPPKLPLFDRIEDINNPSSNFIEIFGIDTRSDVDVTLKNLRNLQMLYHSDKCRQNGFSDDDVDKCYIISQKITKIRDTLKATKSYDFLKQLSSPPTQIKPVSKSLVELSQDITDITDVNDQIQQITFHINLLNQLKILQLAYEIYKALASKYTQISHSYETFFQRALESVAKNITLSFFDDNYDVESLKRQIIDFINKSKRLPNGKYELHDIIDFAGNDRTELGDDYCVALNIFFNLMPKQSSSPFGFSSFYKHKDRCVDASYSPEPTKGSGLTFKNTRNISSPETEKFKNLQSSLSIAKISYTRPRSIPTYTDAYNLFKSQGEGASVSTEGGSKSRRRHRRHRKPMRKTRRGRGRGHTRKSKSKRQIRARKYKKNTYKRCK